MTENGRPAQFSRSDGQLRVALGNTYRAGDLLTLVVKYHGAPSDGLFFKRNKFGDRTVFADNWPNRAHFWFPSLDHPYDKAKVEFFVTAPARYDVVANGRLVETTSRQDGTRLTHWREDVPVAVYCMVFGATEFSIIDAGGWGGTRLLHYLYPKDRERGLADHGRALRMLEFYSELVGPYPYEKLALVQSSTRFGGMENSSNIFFDENSYDGSGGLEGTVAHEIAHQWFGDSVTEADWHHLWLSEGFATYFGALFFERADGRDKFVATDAQGEGALHKRRRIGRAPRLRPRGQRPLQAAQPEQLPEGRLGAAHAAPRRGRREVLRGRAPTTTAPTATETR